jgi:hypothetical protein
MAEQTQTYTYDPSQDTLIDEANAARDAENLEVGEKLVSEHENLLAGKYKTTQDLEKAYKELESKLGSQDDSDLSLNKEESETQEESQTFTKEDFYSEDGSVNYDTANNVYGEQISNVFKENDIDPFKMNDYFVENNGTLSDEMYESLEKAGLNKGLVDSYLDGVRNKVGLQQTEEAPVLSDAEVAEVHSIGGGKDGYEQLMSWATDNLSDADAKNFDDVIATANKAAVTFAVKALMGQYEDAVGRDSTLIQGKKSTPTETYRSMAEVVRAMNNPLYDTDESYRDDVRIKLERSNLKV